jgi:hypothetical protein
MTHVRVRSPSHFQKDSCTFIERLRSIASSNASVARVKGNVRPYSKGLNNDLRGAEANRRGGATRGQVALR